MKVFSIVFLIFSCLAWQPLAAATIRVPADQPTVQAGINAAAAGDTVLVSPGTYVENINFHGKGITVRSLEGPEATVIEGSSPLDPDYGSVATFVSGEGLDSVLDGFTLTGGSGSPVWFGSSHYYSDYLYCGGAVFCRDASPTICNNIMPGSLDIDCGGGVYCREGAPLIRDNTISGHSVYHFGAGICCQGNAVISGNVVTGNHSERFGGGIYSLGYSAVRPVITDNTISENRGIFGGGLCCRDGAMIGRNRISGNQGIFGGGIEVYSHSSAPDSLVTGNTIDGNTADHGGGIYGDDCTLAGNTIIGNRAEDAGGGVSVGEWFTISNNVFSGNSAGRSGGAIHSSFDTAVFNCTLIGNMAEERGGGICIEGGPGMVTVSSSILSGNTAPEGPQINLHSGPYQGPTMSIAHCDLVGGPDTIEFDDDCTLIWGEGMIDADPLFVSGPGGDLYLSQVEAGQPVDSPCLDSGDPDSAWIFGTTRTDGRVDREPVDMGFHYPAQGRVLTGAGPGADNPPLVRVFLPRPVTSLENQFMAYSAPHFGVRVSVGDPDGDGGDDVLTGAGPGAIFGPHVRGFTVDGTPLTGISFLAYGTNKFGVNVAAGDLDGDGDDEIVTGAGQGEVFGPHVRGWICNGQAGVSPMPGVSYFAYGTPKWGVNVAAGDIDGDGFDEIITGAGPGAVYGPHVRGWDVDGGKVAAIPAVSFFAYGTNKFGVNISAGDLDGDGIDELVTGAGPGAVFGPHIRGWNFDGASVTPLTGCSFFAWQTEPLRFGVNVFSGADLDNDGRDELVAGRGPDPDADTEVKVFTYDGVTVSRWFSLEAYPGFFSGTTVAAGMF